MGTRVKFAEWNRDGKRFVVKPPDWPKRVEYSCGSQEELIEWARNNHYMLKFGGKDERPKAGSAGRYCSAN